MKETTTVTNNNRWNIKRDSWAQRDHHRIPIVKRAIVGKWNEAREVCVQCAHCTHTHIYIYGKWQCKWENGNGTRWKWQEKRNEFKGNQNMDSIQRCRRGNRNRSYYHETFYGNFLLLSNFLFILEIIQRFIRTLSQWHHHDVTALAITTMSVLVAVLFRQELWYCGCKASSINAHFSMIFLENFYASKKVVSKHVLYTQYTHIHMHASQPHMYVYA